MECTILIDAGAIVTDDKTMDTGRRNHLTKMTYKIIMDGFPSHLLHPKCMKKVMLTRLYQAKLDITCERLWDKFKEVCSDLQTNYKISDDIPSGMQLRELYNTWLTNMYKKEHVSYFCNVCVLVIS